MKTVVICLLLGCRAEPPAVSPLGPAQGGGCGERSEVREVWDPACLMAIRELAGIGDADEFERAAMAWLEIQEPYVAAEIAADHGRELPDWWHEEVDNTPYGMTVVALGKRLPLHGPAWFQEGGRSAGSSDYARRGGHAIANQSD